MISKAITCFAIIVMQIIIAGFTSAQAAVGRYEENNFTVRCAESRYDCTTTFLKGGTDVSCTYWMPTSKENPISSSITSIYKCSLIVSGSKSWVCRGFIGVAPNLKATFTEEEFRDDQLRCDKICRPCAQGWK